ncbi:hypothetical protein DFP72DRAFT_926344 [Ephemerocybe angulata]|uniref:Uncharacterized protein n=1 Tax=Ephemerocybe angulata TaxID=980116 RepID=A0A8H6HFF0_9AGAR|nr:hypothetical protein DFP72DRAFT_926344 [Tulosesus angulatus]
MRLSGLVANFFLLGSPFITALVNGRPIAIGKERSIALDARNQNAELYALLARNQELAEYLVRELDVDFDALVERKAASESSSSKTVDISRSSPEGAVESNTDVQSNDARTARLGSKNIDTPHLTTPLEPQATDSGRTPSTATSPKSSQSHTGRSGAPGSPDPLPPHNTPLQPPPPPAVSARNKTWGGGWLGTTTSSGAQPKRSDMRGVSKFGVGRYQRARDR